MKTFIQAGAVVTAAAPRDVSAGDGVLVGAVFGVATADAASGDPVEIARGGVYEMDKTSAQAWTAGAKVYWDNTNFEVTTSASGNTLIGAALIAAANPSATGTVLLDAAIR